ncbi:pantetheine-phosphate adenylyltransferase [Porphyromonas circumdentaria]|uniref:Phosphopantetheine adenylyltransferase n=1 Tax=Porphyromonas circumdentaria TaxID=29524 RepID=A0A1T4N465_9PORP|nr:pantetheine-phosphate adenylyltransferase [Porphyromonas circumdentaria]MBB6276024.1 pantetheine-phosphate adenylyltransferase [Porphyromonas circumdentaria]MDO4722414.1 pantetheine-phosphate adenylyltransferase [Porphyromonas circumdentaria]SJZ73934.1 Phosphopantetheine adenylyltransferase [Porphyromonas circumdentaria]
MTKKKALFAGTFDPFTKGHADIVRRGLLLFDRVVIAIGVNPNKSTYFSLEKRLEQIRCYYQYDDRVEVIAYTGLTVDLIKETKSIALLRGIRSFLDYEYEKNLADLNSHLTGVDTVFLLTDQSLSHISSNAVRELLSYGKDVSSMLPEGFLLL